MTQTPGDSSIKLPEPYKTSDTPYAAYLHYCGYKVAGTRQDPNDYKREVIVFIKDEGIDEKEQLWRSSKVTGDLRKYHKSLKIVTRLISESRRKRENAWVW